MLQVRPQLVGVLEPDAEAKEPARDAVALPAVAALDRGADAAEARLVRDQSRRRLDRARVTLDVERDESAEGGIANEGDGGVLAEAARELGRGFGVAAHADVERLQPA